MVSEGAQENLTPGADPNVDMFPKGADDYEDWDFDGAIGGESAQHVGLKRSLLSLQDDCCIKKRRLPKRGAKAFELT